ncbi:MAG: enoyl-CoA hydratase/isomerase family protein [Rhodospirillales bacterium]|nr:enoyl-CoA hydratase/isomerase family protein [Rhodospirillales bacterium]
MSDSLVLTEIDNRGVAWLTLNRPEVHNALNDDLIARLTAELRRLEKDSSVLAVVLAGAGKSFSAGADLKRSRMRADGPLEDNIKDASELAEMMRTLTRLAKPTLALVHGAAIGGGFGLTVASDMAIAAEDAVFCLPEVKLGIIPGVISPYVIAAIGQKQTRRYFLTGERLSAAEARRIGLVNEVVPADQLRDAAENILKYIVQNGPQAMAAAKELIFAVADRPIDEALIRETAERVARTRVSDEGKEGIDAFLEKRNPSWIRS